MWLLEMQTQQWFWVPPDAQRLWLAAAAIVLYALFCFAFRPSRRSARGMHRATDLPAGGKTPFLVTFASQTGFAEQLAWQTADALRGAGLPISVEPLAALGPERLSTAERAL